MAEQGPFVFGPNAHEGWRPAEPSWERGVVCPGECGYMATEVWKRGVIWGICTKCGHRWDRKEPTP